MARPDFIQPVQLEGTTTSAREQFYGDLAQRLKSFTSQYAQFAARKVDVEGEKQGLVEALGGKRELREGSSIYDQAYNRSILRVVGADTLGSVSKLIPGIERKAREQRDDELSNTEWFEATIAGERKVLMDNVPVEILPEMLEYFDRKVAVSLNKLANEDSAKARVTEQNTLIESARSLSESGVAALRDGDDPVDLDAFEAIVMEMRDADIPDATIREIVEKDRFNRLMALSLFEFEEAYEQGKAEEWLLSWLEDVPEGMSVDERDLVYSNAERLYAELEQLHAPDKAAEAESVAKFLDGVNDRMVTGDIPTVAEVNDWGEQGQLGTGSGRWTTQTKLKNAVRKANKEQGQIASIHTAIEHGYKLLQNKQSEDAVAAWVLQQPDPVEAAVDIAKSIGWIPASLETSMANSARSMQLLPVGATLYAQVFDDPTQMPSSKLSVADMSLLAETAAYIKDGHDPATAAEVAWGAANTDDRTREQRKSVYTANPEWADKGAKRTAEVMAEPTGWSFDPDMPPEMVFDYYRTHEQAYLASGNQNTAHEVAFMQVNNNWNLTNINGDWEYQRGGIEGDASDIRSQMLAEVQPENIVQLTPEGAQGEPVTLEDTILVPVPGKADEFMVMKDGRPVMQFASNAPSVIEGIPGSATVLAHSQDILDRGLQGSDGGTNTFLGTVVNWDWLNNGQATLIPSFWEGNPLDYTKATDRAKAKVFIEAGGKEWPTSAKPGQEGIDEVAGWEKTIHDAMELQLSGGLEPLTYIVTPQQKQMAEIKQSEIAPIDEALQDIDDEITQLEAMITGMGEPTGRTRLRSENTIEQSRKRIEGLLVYKQRLIDKRAEAMERHAVQHTDNE